MKKCKGEISCMIFVAYKRAMISWNYVIPVLSNDKLQVAEKYTNGYEGEKEKRRQREGEGKRDRQ